MSELVGTKETREAALGLITVAKKLSKAYKLANVDGKVDLKDLPVALGLLMDAEFVTALQNAVDGVDKIGDEMKDLSLIEGIELVKDVGLAALDAVKEIKEA